MKYIIILFLFFSISGFSQQKLKGIEIDGTVNYFELSDTIHWKTVKNTSNVIIRESVDHFYVAVMSNVYSSVSLYLNQEDIVQILHTSYSLGDSQYYSTKSNTWKSVDKQYRWKFRDPILRDTSQNTVISKEIKEFYNKDISTEEELNEFFKNNWWVASTMPMGSFRDVEILISKRLVEDVNDIQLSYIVKDQNQQLKIQYFPYNLKTLTGDAKADQNLHNGYLAEVKRFNFN